MNSQPQDPRWARSARATLGLSGCAAIVVVMLTSLHGSFIPTFLWGAALTSVGWLLGFLFAFPRPASRTSSDTKPVKDEGAGSDNAGPTQASPIQPAFPDSMSEIADWLTKIIVGLGLVNLGQIPAWLSQLAAIMSHSINPEVGGTARATIEESAARANELLARASVEAPSVEHTPAIVRSALEQAVTEHLALGPGHSFALAFAVFLLANGLMIGYLATRLYILTALNHADREAAFERDRPFATDPSTVYRESKAAAVRLLVGKTQDDASPEPRIEAAMRAIETQYRNVNVEDYNQRVLQKNMLMQQMYSVACAAGVSKQWLAAQQGDAYVHALATMILADPVQGDLGLLIEQGAKAVQKHTRYRVAEALQRLAESGLMSAADKPRVAQLLDKYGADVDGSLKDRVDATRKCLDAIKN